jgi:hypothetical protein
MMVGMGATTPGGYLVWSVRWTIGARVGISQRVGITHTLLKGVVLRPIASAVVAILDPTETLVWRVRKALGVRGVWSRRVGLTLLQMP